MVSLVVLTNLAQKGYLNGILTSLKVKEFSIEF